MEKGLSNSMVRMENKRKLVKMLYKEAALTKQDISVKMGLSLPTVNLLVAQLDQDGLVVKQRSAVSSGGRIPDLLCFNYDARLVFGISIQREECRILLVNLKGDVRSELCIPAVFNDSYTYWRGVRAHLLAVMRQEALDPEIILGVGVALPGAVEHYSKVVEYSSLIQLKNARFDRLEAELGFPVLVENTTNSAGFAESWFRRELESLIYLSVSEEIGGALVYNQNIVYGVHGRCGEFGHMTAVPGGRRCTCGRNGCTGAYLSTNLLEEQAEGDLAAYFANVNESISLRKHWEAYLGYLGMVVSNLCVSLDLPLVLGGKLGQQIGEHFDELESNIENAIPFYAHSPMLYRSQLGLNAPALGVAMIVVGKHLGVQGCS